MRLWSIHPQYLDTKGLVALWREGLLAQKVLLNKTKGYKAHPQLNRFKYGIDKICTYLHYVCDEAEKRGYNFDRKKILKSKNNKIKIKIYRGQIKYEFNHLLNKLKIRNYNIYLKFHNIKAIKVHPIFYIINNDNIETWEKRN